MTRSERIIAERNAAHRAKADALREGMIALLDAEGVEYRFFGSILRKDFCAASDVDLLIEGVVSPHLRGRIESQIGRLSDRAGVAVDMIYAEDIGSDNANILLAG